MARLDYYTYDKQKAVSSRVALSIGDDVREEVNKKVSIVGAFTGDEIKS